ncbi:MAG: transglycosylase [Gammaproteobacteria bacterium]|nr:transglycosylase [Gammaproteobacteria bacterium]
MTAKRSRSAKRRRRFRVFVGAPGSLRFLVAAIGMVILWLALNWIYQVVRKPSELFFPVSGTLYKTPAETWSSYAPLFERYATSSMTPEFLAALAQAEGAGNPVARTYWRWSWRTSPLELYRPASSSVGMYQMTDGTFAEARRYCIRDHAVVAEASGDVRHSCWSNDLYVRVLPSHAVELTSAYLTVHVASTLARDRVASASLRQKQHLAAVIHLCGAGAGDAYARRGFRFLEGQRCGDHDPRAYLAKIDVLKEEFARIRGRPASAI